LAAQLAALGAWRLHAAGATALPTGGCVRLRLERAVETARDLAVPATGGEVRTAAVVVAAAARELGALDGDALDAGPATAQIAEAGDAREAAQRAAWWALAGVGSSAEPELFTALQLSA